MKKVFSFIMTLVLLVVAIFAILYAKDGRLTKENITNDFKQAIEKQKDRNEARKNREREIEDYIERKNNSKTN